MPLHEMKCSKELIASAGNRTQVNCLEGSYARHYTTDAPMSQDRRDSWHKLSTMTTSLRTHTHAFSWRRSLQELHNQSSAGGFHGVMVSTLDSESSHPSSNLGGTYRRLTRLRCNLGPERGRESAILIWRRDALAFSSPCLTLSVSRPLLLVMFATFLIRQLDWNGPLILQSGELFRLCRSSNNL